MRGSVPVALIIGMAAIACAQSPHWEYRGRFGPANWGRLDPANKACSDGSEQSPINIHHAHLNKALKPLEFHFIASPVTLENDGYMIAVHSTSGSYMVIDGERYQLQKVDFHRPSETAVNGNLADMSLGMLFRNSGGKMVMVVVRMNADQDFPNATLSTLWQHLPVAAGTSQQITDVMVNPGGLLPANRGYWTYMGSLTTPPCTEGVRWFVMEQVLSISRQQLRAFTSLFEMNSRPLQDAHGRRIEANE